MINHFISNFNYISKNEDNPKVVTTLKGMVDLFGDFYIMLLTLSNINEVNDKQRVVIDVLKAVEKEELSELINNLEDQSNYLVSQRNELELKREAMNKVLKIIQEDKKVYDTINTLLFGLGIFNNK